MAKEALSEIVTRSHGVELFARSSLKKAGVLVRLLLPNRIGFHLAHLSSRVGRRSPVLTEMVAR